MLCKPDGNMNFFHMILVAEKYLLFKSVYMIIAAIMYQSPLVLVFQKMYVRKKKYQKGCYVIAAHILFDYVPSSTLISQGVPYHLNTFFIHKDQGIIIILFSLFTYQIVCQIFIIYIFQ